jgi:hypothetical protein
MTAVPVLVVGGLPSSVHCATTWIVAELLGAWNIAVREGPFTSMVPSGHGPGGGVVFQLHCAPLAPFVCNSAMLQMTDGAPHEESQPLTVACNGTWPSAGTVALGGVTDTVTSLGLKWLPPPPPQPEMTISKTSGATYKTFRHQFITNPPGVTTRSAELITNTVIAGEKRYHE